MAKNLPPPVLLKYELLEPRAMYTDDSTLHDSTWSLEDRMYSLTSSSTSDFCGRQRDPTAIQILEHGVSIRYILIPSTV